MDHHAEDHALDFAGCVQFGWFIVSCMNTVFLVLLAVILATYAALTRTWAGRAAYAYAEAP